MLSSVLGYAWILQRYCVHVHFCNQTFIFPPLFTWFRACAGQKRITDLNGVLKIT